MKGEKNWKNKLLREKVTFIKEGTTAEMCM